MNYPTSAPDKAIYNDRPAMPERMPQITGQLSAQSSILDDTEKLMSLLLERLAAVSYPKPQPGPSGVEKGPDLCRIAEAVSTSNNRISRINSALSAIINDLEI